MDNEQGKGKEFFTIDEAAKASGLHRTTIYRLIREGRLSPVTQERTGRKLIDKEQLEQACGTVAEEARRSEFSRAQSSAIAHRTRYDGATEALIKRLEQQIEEGKEREAWLRAELEQEKTDRRTLELRLLPAPAAEKEQGREGKKDHTDTLALALFALFLAGFAWLILWR